MANIRKVENKSGISYQITVSAGRSGEKQVRHYKTYKPDPDMTQRQIEKELNRIAVEFESGIEQGYTLDNRQTFSQYAEYVISLKEKAGAKHRTIVRYRDLMKRINAAIGNIKLEKLRPQHLNAFYENLGEPGIREGADKAIPKTDLRAFLSKEGFTRQTVATAAHIAPMTVTVATQGKRISLESANAISKVFNRKTDELFKIERDLEPLSTKTIVEYHRLISTVLAQADKEMLVPYNAATKATPPKLEKNEAKFFEIEEVERIRDCLENEPIKWRTATHLLLITGCRRGEVVGLKWSKVDWEHNQIKIDRALLYSADCGVYEDSTKTSTTRFIKLPEETMLLLKAYKKWYTEQRLKNADRWQNSGYLFVQDDGKPMNPDSLTDWLAKFSKKYNLPDVHPHKFRHTMASILYFNGINSISISKRLGHAKVSTTTDIYSHIMKQADEASSDCIANVVLRPKKQA
jgi:integrase